MWHKSYRGVSRAVESIDRVSLVALQYPWGWTLGFRFELKRPIFAALRETELLEVAHSYPNRQPVRESLQHCPFGLSIGPFVWTRGIHAEAPGFPVGQQVVSSGHVPPPVSSEHDIHAAAIDDGLLPKPFRYAKRTKIPICIVFFPSNNVNIQ